MGDLLYRATRGWHAIDVWKITLVVDPMTVRRIEHVADPVIASGPRRQLRALVIRYAPS
jgi:hypothetical protein